MRLDLSFRKLSLKARLISSYLVILFVGGLVTSFVGSWIVSSTIMTQARRAVDNDFAAVQTLYKDQLQTLKLSVLLTASGRTIQDDLATGNQKPLFDYLAWIRKDTGFDFFTLTDEKGRVVLRVSQPNRTGDDVSSISVVREALAGKVAASTEILLAEALGNEDPGLRDRAHVRLVPTPRARPVTKTEETSGMVLMAAAPVRGTGGRILGALYAGLLLNRNFTIPDRVWKLLFKGDRFQDEDQDIGHVTIFQDDVRISTNVRMKTGERAVGTSASAEVQDGCLKRGAIWRGRAFVVKDWYISEYDPIRDYDGRVIGMLSVGLLESTYTSTRNRVILSFFGIATIGFILIIGITYYMIRNITRPIGEMVAATRSITAGRFDWEVRGDSSGEIALLADSFNAMLKSLRQMKSDLEEWGRTLEQKVKDRTEELVAMHDRVAESERLASLGKLSAGVAHEINNPMGAILSLTALTLEDIKADDPNRENLEEVLRQTQRCRDIVKGLLEFSRQSTANVELTDLNKILQDTLSLISKQALFFNINVIEEWDPQLPPVMADKSQMQQVFMNILMNAVQAMDERGTVTIVTRRSAAGNFVEVVVSDSGHGIPPERIGRVFDPFFTTKASGQGTGLGLSIAYGIVSKHYGTISVESEVDEGSTFTIRLPAASRAQVEAQT
jgi:two-component system NtrC family sensor kinase